MKTQPESADSAQARKWRAQARLAELAARRQEGQVVDVATVQARWLKIATAVRNAVLGVPTRARQRLPHLTTADVAELDRLVREALEALSQLAGSDV